MRATRTWIGLCFAAWLAACATQARSAELDRESEIQSYLAALATDDRRQIIAACHDIYLSGLGDARIGNELARILERDHRSLVVSPRVEVRPYRVSVTTYMQADDHEYGLALVRALGSLGSEQYATTLNTVARRRAKGELDAKPVRSAAARAGGQLGWYRRRNEIMAAQAGHAGGGDPQVSGLVNLLRSDDPLYRDYALEYLYEKRLSEPRLNDELVSLVFAAIEPAKVTQRQSAKRRPEKHVLFSLKLLGLSNDRRYAEPLTRILQSTAEPAIKEHAKVAFDRLK